MQYIGLNELREKYLSFFESKGHLRLKSFSLIPENDASLLLINAGMAPLKPYFTGESTPPNTRVTTCQKCIRTPDIERVGKTARHGTYFEMLGNFSFGDYFKREALFWAWEFLTKVLEIPEELLWPSVFEGDDEAYSIWHDEIKVPAERIVRLGKDDNFWELGSGPCGPCSEIYFDRGEKYGCGSKDCKPGCDCDRFMEIWNNVFSQFNSDGKGNYTELQKKNIDTGMGLERLACVMQGVDNLFETDTVRAILNKTCSIANRTYGKNDKDDVSIRVITDHIRSSVFLISDGVTPSNEGRGYVLRRIIRRAARHGKLLDINKPFLYELCDTVIEENKSAYPELVEKRDRIKNTMKLEEDRFNATLESGLSKLLVIMEEAEKGSRILDGKDCFRLYDTYGFPLDLTRELAAEKGLTIDEDGFNALMQQQKQQGRDSRSASEGWSASDALHIDGSEATNFCGYDNLTIESEVIALIQDGSITDEVLDGQFTLIVKESPFYAEGGGQVGDSGKVFGDNFTATIDNTKKTKENVFLHFCTLESGSVKAKSKVTLSVDSTRRSAIMRNHSAVHLLQATLRAVLGDHVEQAGSYVDENRLRFDFKHFEAINKETLSLIERKVNETLISGLDVSTQIMDIQSAKNMGAMALFGEKYGNEVRVVKMGDASIELCGGTHVGNTAKIGLFKIISESGIAAGIRRIEAVTGLNFYDLFIFEENLFDEVSKSLKSNGKTDILPKVQQLHEETAKLKKELEEKNAFITEIKTSNLKPTEQNGFSLLFAELSNTAPDKLRDACDKFKNSDPNIVVILYTLGENKVNFAAACGAKAVEKGADAGKILKEISPIVGGGGGGRKDSAQSGGKNPEKIALAEKRFFELF